MNEYNEPMLPPPPVATSKGMWVKLYVTADCLSLIHISEPTRPY